MKMTGGDIKWLMRGYKMERLTRESELALIKKVKAGDRLAADKLTRQFYPFIINNANKYASYNIDIEDLISEGLHGFHKAITKFNVKSNNRLLTYASWWVDAYQSRAAKLSASLVRRDMSRGHVQMDVHYEGYSNPDNGELMGDDALDVLMSEMDMHGQERDVLTRKEAAKFINDVINKLPSQERFIARKRFCYKDDQMTLEELGEKYGVSRERIRQLEMQIRNRLKRIFSTYADNYDLQIEKVA